MSDPFDVVRSFEKDLCEYTGAPYAVAVNSCTMALLLACAWCKEQPEFADVRTVTLPNYTYVGVPYAVREAGFEIGWRNYEWRGEYWLDPLPVRDAARNFTQYMFHPEANPAYWRGGALFQAVSFHHSKILGHTQGGAILSNVPKADAWFRRARFDGRAEGVLANRDEFTQHRAWHCYISPDVAAALRWKLAALPRVNAPLPNSDYPDLSLHEAFK